jgi:hypothetical protein
MQPQMLFTLRRRRLDPDQNGQGQKQNLAPVGMKSRRHAALAEKIQRASGRVLHADGFLNSYFVREAGL